MSDISIAGVSIQTYATLCAAMADTGGDQAKELAIAAAAGVSAEAWTEAKAGYTARMQDPADQGRTATAFMPLYQAAQAAARGGGPPCTIELYAEISTSYSYEQDAAGVQVAPAVVFARHGITAAQWSEYTGYWTPKVNDPLDPSSKKFPGLVQAESDRIFGIHRDANGSRVDPDDDEASAEDRAAARAALTSARRPVEGAPESVPASQPTLDPPPPLERAADPVLMSIAQKEPEPVPDPPAPPAPTIEEPAPPPRDAPVATDVVAGLTDEEKMLAAVAHGSALVFLGGLVPLVLWLMHKDGKSAYVAHKAKQALVVHLVVYGLTAVSCGVLAPAIPLWMLAEAWFGYQAYLGKRTGYPGVAPYSG
ncbi:MAG: DUF4870 domain-containing protein [Proteobacteria bacterium]|nr:DUF4870 domain-containing protein [Pseudomonadota bacterium]MCP4916177.1 DUF4870 domain-containing protein [Pseudomonadota bacterium]